MTDLDLQLMIETIALNLAGFAPLKPPVDWTYDEHLPDDFDVLEFMSGATIDPEKFLFSLFTDN